MIEENNFFLVSAADWVLTFLIFLTWWMILKVKKDVIKKQDAVQVKAE